MMNEDKAWYESRTVWGSIVTLLSMAAALAGVEVSDTDAQTLVALLSAAGGAIGGLLSLYGRLAAERRIR